MGVIDRLTPKSPEYKRGTAYVPLSRLAFAVGKVNVKATRNIIEVLTLLISRQRPNEIIQQRLRAERVKQLVEGKFVVKHFRYSIPAPLLEQEGL